MPSNKSTRTRLFKTTIVTFAKSPGRGRGRGAVSYMGSYIGDTLQISEYFEIEQ